LRAFLINFDGALHSSGKGVCLHMSEAADAREGYGITRGFSEPSQCGVGEAALAANWSSALAGESTLGANGETSKIAKRYL